MFLLILIPEYEDGTYTAYFTFHDVSINTPAADATVRVPSVFTFHDVSINTEIILSFLSDLALFTFHDVSINTPKGQYLTVFF